MQARSLGTEVKKQVALTANRKNFGRHRPVDEATKTLEPRYITVILFFSSHILLFSQVVPSFTFTRLSASLPKIFAKSERFGLPPPKDWHYLLSKFGQT